MRVVDPKTYRHSEVQKKPKKKYKKLFSIVPLIIIAVLSLFYITTKKSESPEPVSQLVSEAVEVEPAEVTDENIVPTLRSFSGNEFRLLYDNTSMPNTTKVNVPPPITGNDVADTRIRQIAEQRGYRLRSSPIEKITNVDGLPLQTEVHQPWLDLKAASIKAGLKLTVVSAFRSVDDQRALFLSGLQTEGASVSSIAAGKADKQVDKVLVTTAAPGYSRHHTGYTLDLFCAGFLFENFKNSTCNTWLSANNFEQAKMYGFIPSYPPDADLQGPDPEAWEYVYVGKDVLYY